MLMAVSVDKVQKYTTLIKFRCIVPSNLPMKIFGKPSRKLIASHPNPKTWAKPILSLTSKSTLMVSDFDKMQENWICVVSAIKFFMGPKITVRKKMVFLLNLCWQHIFIILSRQIFHIKFKYRIHVKWIKPNLIKPEPDQFNPQKQNKKETSERAQLFS